MAEDNRFELLWLLHRTAFQAGPLDQLRQSSMVLMVRLERTLSASLALCLCHLGYMRMVLEAGLEPARLPTQDPKSCASANFATRAWYSGWDLNPHVFRQWSLNPPRLPISPPEHIGGGSRTRTGDLQGMNLTSYQLLHPATSRYIGGVGWSCASGVSTVPVLQTGATHLTVTSTPRNTTIA